MPVASQDAIRDCIKSYLDTKGMSHKDLALLLGLSLHTIDNYLSKTPIPEKTIPKIAAALDYPLELLLRGERYYGPDAFKALEERVKRLEEAVFSNPRLTK